MNTIENRLETTLIFSCSIFSSPGPTTQTKAAETQQLCNSQFSGIN